MEKRTSKLQIYFNDAELMMIDEWRFKYRLPSRAAAIRALIGRGLDGDMPSFDCAVLSREIGVLKNCAAEKAD